jgi:hypothetical protein
MKPTILCQCLLAGLCLFAGCQVADPNSVVQEESLSDGLKLSDLKDKSLTLPDAEFLIELRILTYVLNPDSADSLAAVFGVLSQNEIRCASQDAFAANRFAVGTSKPEENTPIAQKLYEMGAVRIGQTKFLIPPGQTEIISSTYLPNGASVPYSPSRGGTSEITVLPNSFIGWIMSVWPDPRLPKMIQINLTPAFWQRGAEDIRLRMGKPAIDFQPVEAGRVLARIEEGGFLLLGHVGQLPNQPALDKALFFLPGRRPKVQFFVIICDKAGL